MKRFFICFLFIFCVCFSGCQSDFEKVSKKLNTYDINITFNDESKILHATQVVNYTNKTDVVIDILPFHLYPNAFRQGAKNKPVSLAAESRAYPNGIDYGYIDVTKLIVCDKEMPVKIGGVDENILQVDVGNLYPDDNIKIEMEYDVKLANCKHRLGYGDNTYNFGNFYPIACVYDNGEFMQKPYSYNGDPFYSEVANYNVTIKTKNDFVLASSGEQKSLSKTDNFTTYNITANVVRDFAFVLSKNFQVASQMVNDTIVNYYYFEDENYQKSLDTSVKSLAAFEDMFGDYPYSSLSICESDFLHGGMEYPTLVYISNDVTDYSEYTNVIVHEIAHQWWYGIVGNNEFDEPWLDEALAEMSCLMFYDKNPEYNISTDGKKSLLVTNYAMFLDVFRAVYGDVNESMTRALDEYISETEYTYITYVKGNIMLADLQDFVGKKRFEKALKKYYSANKFKIAKADNLISSFISVCGKDAGNFIKSYLDGSAKITTK